VKNNEIVLNVGFEATTGLKMGNDAIEFKARFGGVSRNILVPVDHVIAIYARENGQGMAFPSPQPNDATARGPGAAPTPLSRGPRLAASEGKAGEGSDADDPEPTEPTGGHRPSLKRIK
jgi:stringent starvation protein B